MFKTHLDEVGMVVVDGKRLRK